MQTLKQEERASIRTLGKSTSLLSRNSENQPHQFNFPIVSGTNGSMSIGVGLKYISPETMSGPIHSGDGTLGSGANDLNRRRQGFQNSSMQLLGNDFADLKYFDPGEHLAMGVTAPGHSQLMSSNLQSRTFDNLNNLTRPQPNMQTPFKESYSQFRKDSYSRLSDSKLSQHKSADNRTSRMDMINQAVHRYDSALKKIEKRQEMIGANNTGAFTNSRGPINSFEEPGSTTAMHSSIQFAKFNNGQPVSILKKKPSSNIDDSFSMSLNEKERAAKKPTFGIKLFPTELEEKIVLDKVRAPDHRQESPSGYQFLRNKKLSNCSFKSFSDQSRGLSQLYDNLDSKSRRASYNDEKRMSQTNNISDSFFPQSLNYSREDDRERNCPTGNFNKYSPNNVNRNQSQQKLYTLASAGGSDFKQNNYDSQINCFQSNLLVGSKTQENFTRQQHEELVRSMNNQIQRKNQKQKEEFQLGHNRQRVYDSYSSQNNYPSSGKRSRKDQIKEDVRKRSQRIDEMELIHLKELNRAKHEANNRGRAQDFREILRRETFQSSRGSRGSRGSGSFDSRTFNRMSRQEHNKIRERSIGLHNPMSNQFMDHSLSRLSNGNCPLRYKLKNQNKSLDNKSFHGIQSQMIIQKPVQHLEKTDQINVLDQSINNRVRNLSEENKYEIQDNCRQIKMKDKINRLKQEFDDMFSARDRSNQAILSFNSNSRSYEDYAINNNINRLNKDLNSCFSSNNLQFPYQGDSTAKFKGFLSQDKLMGSTAPIKQSTPNEYDYGTRCNHFTLGEQARNSCSPNYHSRKQQYSPNQNTQSTGLNIRSKSAQIVFGQNYQNCDETNFQNRINNLSNTFLQKKKVQSPTNTQTGMQDIIYPSRNNLTKRESSKQLPILDATQLKYQKQPQFCQIDCGIEEQTRLRIPEQTLVDNEQNEDKEESFRVIDQDTKGYYPKQLLSVPFLSGEHKIQTNRPASSSPSKSTIHQVIKKSPPNIKLKGKKLFGNRSNSSNLTFKIPNVIGTQILLNKERLRRLLKEESSSMNRQQIKNRNLQRTSVSNNSRGQTFNQSSTFKNTKSIQNDNQQSQLHMLDSQGNTNDHQQSQNTTHQTQSMAIPKSNSLNQEPSPSAQPSTSQNLSQHSQAPLKTMPLPTFTNQSLAASHQQSISLGIPPKQHQTSVSESFTPNISFNIAPQKVEQQSEKMDCKERQLLQSEVALLKEEVANLQNKISQKCQQSKESQNNTKQDSNDQKFEKQDQTKIDQEKLTQQIENFKIVYATKYKQKYEKRLIKEREINQTQIDNLKIELQNIQLRYGKRVSKMEAEIKTAAATQLKDLEQRYKERELKIISKYEKKNRELEYKIQVIQKQNLEQIQNNVIEIEVNKRVEKIVQQKDEMIKVAQQKVSLLERLLELQQKENSQQLTSKINTCINSPQCDKTTMAGSVMQQRDRPGTQVCSGQNTQFIQTSQNSCYRNSFAQPNNEAPYVYQSIISDTELCQTQDQSYKLEPHVCSMPTQRSLQQNQQIKVYQQQQTHDSNQTKNKSQKHQRSKSMTLNGASSGQSKRGQVKCQLQQNYLLPNSTMKSFDQAKNLIDISTPNIVLSPTNKVDQAFLKKYIQQMQSHSRVKNQSNVDLIPKQISTSGETILSSKQTTKRQNLNLKKQKQMQDIYQINFEGQAKQNIKMKKIQDQGQNGKLPSHFQRYNGPIPLSQASSSNCTTKSGQVFQTNQDLPQTPNHAHHMNYNNIDENELVNIDQQKENLRLDQIQNRNIANDSNLEQPLVLNVFDPSHGMNSTDSEVVSYSEKENIHIQ